MNISALRITRTFETQLNNKAGYCEHGNEAFGSTNDGKLLDYERDSQLLKEDFVLAS
jgi:hypothetical protein